MSEPLKSLKTESRGSVVTVSDLGNFKIKKLKLNENRQRSYTLVTLYTYINFNTHAELKKIYNLIKKIKKLEQQKSR